MGTKRDAKKTAEFGGGAHGSIRTRASRDRGEQNREREGDARSPGEDAYRTLSSNRDHERDRERDRDHERGRDREREERDDIGRYRNRDRGRDNRECDRDERGDRDRGRARDREKKK